MAFGEKASEIRFFLPCEAYLCARFAYTRRRSCLPPLPPTKHQASTLSLFSEKVACFFKAKPILACFLNKPSHEYVRACIELFLRHILPVENYTTASEFQHRRFRVGGRWHPLGIAPWQPPNASRMASFHVPCSFPNTIKLW